MLRGSTRQIPDSKLLLHSIYDVLTQILNDIQRLLCHVQCRQTLNVVAQHVWYRHGVHNLSRKNKASDCMPSAP